MRTESGSHVPLIAVVGPTASGKSELAVQLARRFNGEIISCDSRQVYKGMDIGTGKVPGKWKTVSLLRGRAKVIPLTRFVYKGIPHHCIDFINPRVQYSVARFQKDATKTIRDIVQRGKVPILCGGTGHWVDAVVFSQSLPNARPDKKLRTKLEKKSIPELFAELQKHDPERAKTIDSKNPRRLIRALEIVLTTGRPVPKISQVKSSIYSTLWLGISLPQDALYEKIDRRLKARLRQGMAKEVQNLHNAGLSWKKLESFGLEYKYISLYLQQKLSKNDMMTQLSFAIKHYAKRQMTWFKRNKNIQWISGFTEGGERVENFLS